MHSSGEEGAAVDRRLAAILAADVVGYSRLMHADDRAALHLLTESRALFAQQVASHAGRIVNAPGDSVLAEFSSVVKAVECAIELQRLFELRNEALPNAQRMLFRMGVNLGDVLVDSSGVYGNGVNVAARLESLCEPGAIAISASAYEQVRDRVKVRFTDAGEHEVKNIERPVHVYRIDVSSQGTSHPAEKNGQTPPQRKWRHQHWLWVLACAVMFSVLASYALTGSSLENLARRVVAAMTGGDSVGRSDRATIAVLPLANQSGDAQRDYFSDGITEDIINSLGRFSGVEVISYNAVQAYKDKATTTEEISRELSVRYIARGSVREADGKLRVAVELSDASTGKQLWSDRFEDSGQQVFELQDKIVRNIVGTLAVKLTQVEQQRIFSKPTDSLAAYDLVLRARKLHLQAERNSNREERALLAQALALSPGYAAAYVALADAEWHRALYGWVEDPAAAIERSEKLALKALTMDDAGSHARAHGLLGQLYLVRGNFDQALVEANLAIGKNGSDASAYASRASVLLWKGRIAEAITSDETAMRFDPQLPPGVRYELAFAYYMTDRYQDALAIADRGLLKNPEFHNFHIIRMMSLAELGDIAGAQQALSQALARMPFFQADQLGTRFEKQADRDKVRQSLRKVGL